MSSCLEFQHKFEVWQRCFIMFYHVMFTLLYNMATYGNQSSSIIQYLLPLNLHRIGNYLLSAALSLPRLHCHCHGSNSWVCTGDARQLFGEKRLPHYGCRYLPFWANPVNSIRDFGYTLGRVPDFTMKWPTASITQKRINGHKTIRIHKIIIV
jgi:hypothetical protein